MSGSKADLLRCAMVFLVVAGSGCADTSHDDAGSLGSDSSDTCSFDLGYSFALVNEIRFGILDAPYLPINKRHRPRICAGSAAPCRIMIGHPNGKTYLFNEDGTARSSWIHQENNGQIENTEEYRYSYGNDSQLRTWTRKPNSSQPVEYENTVRYGELNEVIGIETRRVDEESPPTTTHVRTENGRIVEAGWGYGGRARFDYSSNGILESEEYEQWPLYVEHLYSHNEKKQLTEFRHRFFNADTQIEYDTGIVNLAYDDLGRVSDIYAEYSVPPYANAAHLSYDDDGKLLAIDTEVGRAFRMYECE